MAVGELNRKPCEVVSIKKGDDERVVNKSDFEANKGKGQEFEGFKEVKAK